MGGRGGAPAASHPRLRRSDVLDALDDPTRPGASRSSQVGGGPARRVVGSVGFCPEPPGRRQSGPQGARRDGRSTPVMPTLRRRQRGPFLGQRGAAGRGRGARGPPAPVVTGALGAHSELRQRRHGGPPCADRCAVAATPPPQGASRVSASAPPARRRCPGTSRAWPGSRRSRRRSMAGAWWTGPGP